MSKIIDIIVNSKIHRETLIEAFIQKAQKSVHSPNDIIEATFAMLDFCDSLKISPVEVLGLVKRLHAVSKGN